MLGATSRYAGAVWPTPDRGRGTRIRQAPRRALVNGSTGCAAGWNAGAMDPDKLSLQLVGGLLGVGLGIGGVLLASGQYQEVQQYRHAPRCATRAADDPRPCIVST